MTLINTGAAEAAAEYALPALVPALQMATAIPPNLLPDASVSYSGWRLAANPAA